MNDSQGKAIRAIREAAIDWVVRLGDESSTQADRVAFSAWLRTSPVHVREYLNAEAGRYAVSGVLETDSTDARALLENPTASNVHELFESETPSAVDRSAVKGTKRHIGLVNLVATVVVGVAAIVAQRYFNVFDLDTYSTEVGKTRNIILEDGSIVELNTDSKIHVDYSTDTRQIRLERGEAYFTVAKDAVRPFRVISDRTSIRALGTQFNVYRKPTQTVVTVLQGKVAVGSTAVSDATERVLIAEAVQTEEEQSPQPRSLQIGNRAVIANRSGKTESTIETRQDADRDASWRQSRLIFHNEPLASVVAEFNRYNRQQLVIRNPVLENRGISGVFDPYKPQGLLMFLQRLGNVEVQGDADDRIVLR
jgi:transmembrane sensor